MSSLLFSIAALTAEHAAEVLAIYREGIESGYATFETSVPDWPTWDQKFLPHCRLVVLNDQNRPLAWAALSRASSRAPYHGVAELSIYVGAANRGLGLGSRLLEALIACSEQHGFWTLQAVVLAPNKASIQLHLHAGFRQVGFREKIAKLRGEWLDSILLERRSQKIF